MTKDATKSSKTGALVTVLLVLWLAGLTALVLMYLKKPAPADIDTRVAKLESKANTLVGKVNPPGAKGLNDLEGRVAELEKRISGLSSGEVQPVSAGTDGNGGCDCDRLENRVASLESSIGTVSAKGTAGGAQTARTPKIDTSKTAAPEKENREATQAGEQATAQAQVKPETPKKGPGVTKKTASKSRSKSAAQKTSSAQRAADAPPAANEANARYNQDYGSGSIHDMNRRYAPIYGGSSDDASSRGLLTPEGGAYR